MTTYTAGFMTNVSRGLSATETGDSAGPYGPWGYMGSYLTTCSLPLGVDTLVQANSLKVITSFTLRARISASVCGVNRIVTSNEFDYG